MAQSNLTSVHVKIFYNEIKSFLAIVTFASKEYKGNDQDLKGKFTETVQHEKMRSRWKAEPDDLDLALRT